MKKTKLAEQAGDYSLPSTSKQTPPRANILPHVVSLPTSSSSNMKVLQLAPIANLPKGKIKLIKIETLPSSLQHVAKNLPTKIGLVKPSPALMTAIRSSHISTFLSKKLKSNSPPKRNTQQTDAQKCTEQMSDNYYVEIPVIPSKPAAHVDKKPHENKTMSNKHVRDIIRKTNKQLMKKEESEKGKSSNEKKTKSKNLSINEESSIEEKNLYLAEGFRTDVEMLLEKCSNVFKLNFEKFINIWQELNFSRIFHGRQSGAELAEFTEEAILIAKSYMLAENVSLEDNIAGLFLVYALLNLQPFRGYATLRLVPEDVPAVVQLENAARKQRRHDVLYILGSVLIRGPTQYHVLPREVAIELPIRKYYDGTVQVSEQISSVLTRTASCVPQLKEIASMEQRYAALRQKIALAQGGKDKVRKLCTAPAASLLKKYRAHITREIESTTGKKAQSPDRDIEDRKHLLQSIRHKAMVNTCQGMRHLSGVQERLKDEQPAASRPINKNTKSIHKKVRTSRHEIVFASSCDEDEVTQRDEQKQQGSKEMPTLDSFEKSEVNKDTDVKPSKERKIVKTSRQTKKSDDTNNNKSANKRKIQKNADGPKKRIRKKTFKYSESDSESFENVDGGESQGKKKADSKKVKNMKKISKKPIDTNGNGLSRDDVNNEVAKETDVKNNDTINKQLTRQHEIESTIDEDPKTL